MARFFLINTGPSGECIAVTGSELTIGRAPDRDLRIERDQWVSREHCTLLIAGETITVRDDGSRWGTFIERVPIEQPTVLKTGQVLSIGMTQYRLEER